MRNRTIGWLAVTGVLIGAAAVFYLLNEKPAPTPVLGRPVDQPEVSAPPPEPAIRYPVPEAASAEPKSLPALDQSDKTVWSALSDLLGRHSMAQLFRPENMVRNIVVTVDNLPRQMVAPHLMPTKPVPGAFAVRKAGKTEETLSISPANAARYKAYVGMAELVNTRRLVDIYFHFYPLFQRAYQDLGYPKGYFNDRLVAVIDHMLEAPEVEGPIAVEQPHVLYRFADPELENASAGHKIMIRMGRENEDRIKAKLRELRRTLTESATQPSRQTVTK